MNRLDRRALFASGAAAALLAATGASASGGPKRGGTLRLAVPRENDVLDRLARWAVLDALVEIGPDGVLRGELAQHWHSDSKAQHWEFDLHPEARFHGVGAVTADHVVASLTRSLTLPCTIEAHDPQKLILTLNEPNPHLPYLLAEQRNLITLKETQLSELTGSGCYEVVRATEGRNLRLQRVAKHYKDQQAGWFEAVDIVVIPNGDIRAEALRDGFVDMALFPQGDMLCSRRNLVFHPSVDDMQIAAHRNIAIPPKVGQHTAIDDGRLIERWWML